MRVFVLGASGAIGTRLVPQLVDRSHEAIGSSHSPDRAKRLRSPGAEPFPLDALDARAVREAVGSARPDACRRAGGAVVRPRSLARHPRCRRTRPGPLSAVEARARDAETMQSRETLSGSGLSVEDGGGRRTDQCRGEGDIDYAGSTWVAEHASERYPHDEPGGQDQDDHHA
jgi:NAD dependent epimerase/dehydratase family